MGRKRSSISGQLADIDLRLLRVFRAVVDAGGFTAAELELNLANSTITNYISDLEKRLDMRLCYRGRSGFFITEQGQIVYDSTLELLNAVEQFRYTVNRSHNRILGSLHIGLAEHMISISKTGITQALDYFSQKAPEVNIKITTLSSEEVVNALLNHRIEIGITVLTQNYSTLQTHNLFEEQMLLYCAIGHPLFDTDKLVTPKALQSCRFVESPRLLPGREIHPDVTAWNKQAKAHHQEARISLILSGHYLGFLPSHLVNSWGLSKQLKPLLPDRYGYNNQISALWHDNNHNHEIIKIFTDCLIKSVDN